jgi:tRNA pseudouridine55 synthase
MNGFINLIKKRGISSNTALQEAKRKLKVKKAGHLGTLDPMAHGVLVLGINRGTKFSSYFLESDKTYKAEITLGASTDTDDAMGKTIEESSKKVCAKEVEIALKTFIGKSMQVPPSYSALKHKGKPLYKYAREGKPISKPPREVVIYSIKNFEFKNNICICEIHCSKGTYIRSIARDLGNMLGVGGHLSDLERLGQGVFNIKNAYTIEQLNENSILSIESAFPNFLNINLSSNETKFFLNGVKIKSQNYPDAIYKTYSDKGIFLGLGEVQDSNLKLKQLV